MTSTTDTWGSGDLIKIALSKYGKSAFERVIIQEFDTPAEAYALEKELVNLEYIKRRDTYNLCVGGVGGRAPMTPEQIKEHSIRVAGQWTKERKEIQSNRCSGANNPMAGRTGCADHLHTPEMAAKISQSLKGVMCGDKNHMFGKSHNTDTKRKMSDAKKGIPQWRTNKSRQNAHIWALAEECYEWWLGGNGGRGYGAMPMRREFTGMNKKTHGQQYMSVFEFFVKQFKDEKWNPALDADWVTFRDEFLNQNL
ncbi:nuclease associated modular domain 3 protein [Vibrio phage 1.244.A._10N.261.54.C3]|nr:nuclease associated modular domain 3 protein [Vibrio phage 1.244.A._10N.261.54.C3]AUR98664.1 nuclease associated modular domain 3 protein [Vibrio phage 1.255.O._10N.286.45.F1]